MPKGPWPHHWASGPAVEQEGPLGPSPWPAASWIFTPPPCPPHSGASDRSTSSDADDGVSQKVKEVTGWGGGWGVLPAQEKEPLVK